MENEKKNIIVRLQDFLETKKGQTILNYLYSWGAAIVILGALFKLTHIKGADIMLWIGMGTEVLVFFISGFDRQASSLGSGEASESGAGTGAGPIVIGGGVPVVGGAPSTVAAASAGEVAPLDAESLAAMANLAAANAAAAASAAAGPSPKGFPSAGSVRTELYCTRRLSLSTISSVRSATISLEAPVLIAFSSRPSSSVPCPTSAEAAITSQLL